MLDVCALARVALARRASAAILLFIVVLPFASTMAETYQKAGVLAMVPGALRAGQLSPLFELRAEGGAVGVRYMLFMPGTWSPADAGSGKHPVILFLHGAGGVDNEPNVRGQSMGRLLGTPEFASSFPFIALVPILPSRGWEQLFPALLPMLDMVNAELGGDPARTIAMGQSMGGNGAWHISAKHPDRFAAVVPVCGHLDRDAGASGQLGLVNKNLARKPIWVFHSADDSVVPVTQSDVPVESLRAAGNANVKYTRYATAPPCVLDSGRELPGHGSYELAFKDPSLYEWLLQQSLGKSEL